MAQQYGDVFQIKLGSRNVVVLNGEDTIKQALIQKGTDFAGRPDFISFKLVSGGKSLAFGSYSNLWKAHRRIAQSTVRAFSTSNPQTKKAFEQHIISEIRELVKVFLKKTKQEKYFRPSQILTVATANIISALCFGKRYSYEDVEFKSVVGRNNQFTETVGAGSLVDVMPWLQFFPNPIKTMFGNFKNLNLEFFAFIEDKVIYIYIVFSTGVCPCKPYEEKFQLLSVQDNTTTTTTATTTINKVYEVVLFPEMQTRLQQEVDKVVDRTRLPSIEDQPSLPYVMAFIYEAMRFSSFMPGTIPHSTTTDTSVNGYHIPKNTVIFVNQWSVNHNAQKWANPGVFDPTRFVSKTGDLNKDLTNSVLIFSVGKRRCIGEELSKMQLFLYTAILAHQCNFIANPDEPSTLDSCYGLTLKPTPFSIAVTHRGSMDVMDSYVTDLQKADNSM
ncbi:UNVERIFIED_CONTAM: hypothetical protein FKN15_031731 [Acipenser sinensis]